MGATIAVALDAVTVRRGGRSILDAASVRLEGPGVVRLSGANGSGKSTALRVIAGIERPAAGRVRASHPPAFLPERFAGTPELRVRELLALARARADGSWASGAGDALRTGELAALRLGDLSHGQAQRVALAAALGSPSPVLLLDEPWDGLDDATAATLTALLADRGRTALVVATAHGDARRIPADRELRVQDGRLRAVEPAAGAAPVAAYEATAVRADGTREPVDLDDAALAAVRRAHERGGGRGAP